MHSFWTSKRLRAGAKLANTGDKRINPLAMRQSSGISKNSTIQRFPIAGGQMLCPVKSWSRKLFDSFGMTTWFLHVNCAYSHVSAILTSNIRAFMSQEKKVLLGLILSLSRDGDFRCRRENFFKNSKHFLFNNDSPRKTLSMHLSPYIRSRLQRI